MKIFKYLIIKMGDFDDDGIFGGDSSFDASLGFPSASNNS